MDGTGAKMPGRRFFKLEQPLAQRDGLGEDVNPAYEATEKIVLLFDFSPQDRGPVCGNLDAHGAKAGHCFIGVRMSDRLKGVPDRLGEDRIGQTGGARDKGGGRELDAPLGIEPRLGREPAVGGC